MILCVIGCMLVYFEAVTATDQCPNLVPEPYMFLSHTTGFAGDPAVQVTCDGDYRLSTNELVKYVGCEVGGTWNDTIDSCVMKECPNINTILSPEMTSSAVGVSRIGDNVTIECMDGFAFELDMNLPVGERVTSSKTVVCENQEGSLTGSWEPIGDCTAIMCEEPPEVPNAFRTYDNLTFGATVQYRCYSGFITTAWVYSIGAVCNESASWETNVGDDHDLSTIRCGGVRDYLGCVNSSCITVALQSTADGASVSLCRDFCKTQEHRFAALENGTCSCSDVIDITCHNVNLVEACNSLCPQYDPSVSESSQPVFCGSADGHASVYLSYEGCFEGITTTGIPSVNVTGDAEITCREHCRASEFSHAGQNNKTCFCLNITDIDGVKANEADCMMSTNNYMHIYDTTKKRLSVSTCDMLFEKGVRMSGNYYLINPVRKEHCNFKDGTVCEPGWVGYMGQCYYSYMDGLLEFEEAREFCNDQGAELVSILSEEEQIFLDDYRKTFYDIWGDHDVTTWWLGMADDKNSSLFLWLDGSLMTYSNFKVGTPANPELQCAAEDAKTWHDTDCAEEYNVMCKKEAGWSDCIEAPSVNHTYSIMDAMMTLTFCLEICKGQLAKFALVQNTTCLCAVTEPPGTFRAKTECVTPCPGHKYQHCGGDRDVYTYLNVSNRRFARSCAELQLIGLGENDFQIQQANTPAVQHCGIPECPYSWVFVDGHCYRAHLSTKTVPDSFTTCAEDDSYMVSIETESEIDQLMDAIGEISIYRGQNRWRLGLHVLSMNGGLYRWANGFQVDPALWSNNFTNTAGSCVAVSVAENYTWHAVGRNEEVFICERGQDYVGCFMPPTSPTIVPTPSSSLMTIQLCVEACRAEGTTYAYINHDSCMCGTNLTEPLPGLCSKSCAGQINQVCGGNNGMSVYNISAYPPIAEKCEDLFDAGIFHSREYLVNGTLTHCDLLDGTVCDDNWLGYKGNCYQHYPASRSNTRAEKCKARNATMTSLSSMEEYDFITSYIRRRYFPHSERVFSGITNGNYGLDVFISQDGLLVDPDLITTGTLTLDDLYDDEGFVSFRIDKKAELKKDGGVICKKDKYVLGCFEKPTLTPVLENYNSMELTLCRQLCVAAGHNVTLLGNNFCSCSSLPEVDSLTDAHVSCDDPCPIHKNQSCGDGTVVWAYQTTGGESPYAQNCSTLYRAGIFYKATYLIMKTAPEGTLKYEQCGFSDNTVCPPTWFGNQGECYKFFTNSNTYLTAITNCFMHDGYLFNPINASQNTFIDDVITTSGLFDGMMHWHSGIYTVFYNATYVSSNGSILEIDLTSGTNKPETSTVYEVGNQTWIHSSATLPSVCQQTKGFLGCQDVTSVPDATFEAHYNSLTMCIQWCLGLDMLYAATHLTKCACFSSRPIMTSSPGNCLSHCDGVASQPCGGTLQDGTELSTVVEIVNETTVVTSCADLYTYAVTEPGLYYIRNSTDSLVVSVTCFREDGPYGVIDKDHVVHMVGSTFKTGHPSSYIWFTFPHKHVWKPKVDNTGQKVKLIFDIIHIVTGILTAGLRDHEGQSYVQSYTLQYREIQNNQMVDYIQNGSTVLHPVCDNTFGLCRLYLLHPFFTNEIRVTPVTWHESISLQILNYGQNFTLFDHFNHYIGCFLDKEGDLETTGLTLELADCRDHCNQNHHVFTSIDENGECLCGSSGIQHGQLADDSCPTHPNGSYHTSLSNKKAVYRTYETICEDPSMTELQNGNISHVHFPLTDNVFTYGTEVTYSCDTGYEFTNSSESDVIYCQQNNEWTNLTKTCQIISCPAFTVVRGQVNFTSLEYQGEANVTCDPGYWAENTLVSMTVTCEANKTWTITPTCTVHNRRSSQRHYSVTVHTFRETSSSMLTEMKSRSKVECAARCTENYFCKGANFKMTSTGSDEGMCRLFTSDATSSELSADSNWYYFET